jgi:hypothetical protein
VAAFRNAASSEFSDSFTAALAGRDAEHAKQAKDTATAHKEMLAELQKKSEDQAGKANTQMVQAAVHKKQVKIQAQLDAQTKAHKLELQKAVKQLEGSLRVELAKQKKQQNLEHMQALLAAKEAASKTLEAQVSQRLKAKDGVHAKQMKAAVDAAVKQKEQVTFKLFFLLSFSFFFHAHRCTNKAILGNEDGDRSTRENA